MILVLNCGSSSMKYRVFGAGEDVRGTVERIGEPGGPAGHGAALVEVFQRVPAHGITAIGHRIVHGGTRYQHPVVVDDRVLSGLRELVPLAPLHNPAGIAGIEAARQHLPGAVQVAAFDTAFHAHLPDVAATYAIDQDVARHYGIRRYGFHGISHEFVAARAAELLERRLAELNLVVLHLGNGASATAVRGGRSVDTSMGFTPLEGLVMGTRGGDLDPAIPGYLQRAAGYRASDVDDLLQHRSGLIGLAATNDLRDILARRRAGDAAASLAFDLYCYRIRKYVGAYHAVLGRLDAIVFTAGVGANSPDVRAAALAGLDGWGIHVDAARNAAGAPARLISAQGAPVAVCVVPTDEERAIAGMVAALLPARA